MNNGASQIVKHKRKEILSNVKIHQMNIKTFGRDRNVPYSSLSACIPSVTIKERACLPGLVKATHINSYTTKARSIIDITCGFTFIQKR